MRTLQYFIIGCFCALYACGTREEVQKLEISYKTENFRVESTGGCSSDTSKCAYYEVSFPVFEGLDSTVSKIIKEEISQSVSMGNPEAEGKTMKEIGDGFIEEFEDFVKEMPEESMGWHYRADVKVEILNDTLIAMSVSDEYFTGGAHGGYGTYFINIDPRNGKEYKIADFFHSRYVETLTEKAEQAFRTERSLEPDASLADNYFEFPDNTFQLNSNFGFKKDTIVFFYNSYEIAPYAAGPTEVAIALKELTNILK